MDDQDLDREGLQVPPDLQFVPQLSPSSARVAPGSVRTSSSSSSSAAAAAPAAAGPFESGKAPESQSASRQTAHNHGLV